MLVVAFQAGQVKSMNDPCAICTLQNVFLSTTFPTFFVFPPRYALAGLQLHDVDCLVIVFVLADWLVIIGRK